MMWNPAAIWNQNSVCVGVCVLSVWSTQTPQRDLIHTNTGSSLFIQLKSCNINITLHVAFALIIVVKAEGDRRRLCGAFSTWQHEYGQYGAPGTRASYKNKSAAALKARAEEVLNKSF